jgi:uncharacterized repeat protein (TIGR03803 family)
MMKATRKATFVVICTAAAIVAPAQTFTTLLDFNGVDGSEPYLVSLVQGRDGGFYGTTEGGGSRICWQVGCGEVFRVTSGGTLTALQFNNAPDSSVPFSGLVLAANGSFYGTTQYGGTGHCYNVGFPKGCGTIFELTPPGLLRTLYSFCTQSGCPDGESPYAALTLAADGNLYGTTRVGGMNGDGTVFRVTPSGVVTTIYSFCSQSNCTDGSRPYAGLVQGDDGNLYGTTSLGGDETCGVGLGCGTVFKITRSGTLAVLHRFEGSDGSEPTGVITLGNDGNFYGTTYLGGDLTCMQPIGCGTIFRITPAGTLITLDLLSTANGGPTAPLVLGNDGNFYGTTAGVLNGIALNYGTVFKVTPSGALTTLHTFVNSDGSDPTGGLLQATSGVFYGTTLSGGNLGCNKGVGCGTIFTLNTGLGPFVAFVQRAGLIGQTAEILGQGFTGTTNVSFNGVSANFSVKSDTFLTATVPSGATTGPVAVTTPSGTLNSNVPFHVVQ